MKIAIIGSRNYQHLNKVRTYVESLPDDTIIVSGGARGVDKEAEKTAKLCGLKTIIFHANWDKYGTAAGKIRNPYIVNEADMIVAFWDGVSPGTQHSIDLAKCADKPVKIIN